RARRRTASRCATTSTSPTWPHGSSPAWVSLRCYTRSRWSSSTCTRAGGATSKRRPHERPREQQDDQHRQASSTDDYGGSRTHATYAVRSAHLAPAGPERAGAHGALSRRGYLAGYVLPRDAR